MERIKYQDLPNGLYENLRSIELFIENSTIDSHLIYLLKLRVSQINGCAYCVDMHHKELKHIGESDLRLSSLCVWDETHYFTEKEKAALTFAEALTITNAKPLPNKLFDNLLLHFSKTEISYIALAISQINTWNRLMKTFGTTPGNYKIENKKAA